MKHTCVLLTAILLLKLVTPGLASTKPNIIVILADDLGWKDLGCYGSESFQTPCLDQLAASGMRFTSAYAASCVCSPTRASIMTGNYSWKCTGSKQNSGRIRDDQPLLTEVLKAVGYRTYALGKLHFVPLRALSINN